MAVTARERTLIEAMAARYGEKDDALTKAEPPADRICGFGAGATAHPLDVLYSDRMRLLAAAYPDDPDVTTLYAEATMIATRVDWWDRKTGKAAPGIAEMTERLERALAKTPDHTGLNHFLVHAVDLSPAPQRATVAADRLGRLAPESPHLLHKQRAATREGPTAEFKRSLPMVTLVRLERWIDVLEEPAVSGTAGIAPAIRSYARGMALARRGDRTGRWQDAEAAFRSDLADEPGSGWSLRGLRRALTAEGRAETAQRVQVELDRAWISADAGLLK